MGMVAAGAAAPATVGANGAEGERMGAPAMVACGGGLTRLSIVAVAIGCGIAALAVMVAAASGVCDGVSDTGDGGLGCAVVVGRGGMAVPARGIVCWLYA